MVRIVINRTEKVKIVRKIVSFYIGIWYDRLVNITLRKYAFSEARKNIISALEFFKQTFDDNQVKKTTLTDWQTKGWYEIQYKNWHFAIIIQLSMFGDNIAIVQDCVHNKDYHNDMMETSPFAMDSPNDKSHLVDWEIRPAMGKRIHSLIHEYLSNRYPLTESVRKSVRMNECELHDMVETIARRIVCEEYKPIGKRKFKTKNGNNEHTSVVTLQSDSGQVCHIAEDDHCYVLYNGDDLSDENCVPVHYIFPEAVKALQQLPLP